MIAPVNTRLHDLIPQYEAWRNERRPLGRDVKRRTMVAYKHCLNSFATYLRRPPTVADLTPQAVNAWLAAMLEAGMSPRTVHSRRIGVGTIWRFAFRRGLTTERADDVRPVFLPALRPQGYSAEQAALLLRQAGRLEGTVRKTDIPRRYFMQSMIATLWDTGLRCGDCCHIACKDFDPARSALYVIESKTGKSGFKLLRPDTAAMITRSIASTPERDLIWPGMQPVAIAKAIKRLGRDAGVAGGAKYLRRGSASEVERTHPGAGWRFLSHSTPDIFEKFYRDVSLTDRQALMPPTISFGSE